jgi:hypothetical protein
MSFYIHLIVFLSSPFVFFCLTNTFNYLFPSCAKIFPLNHYCFYCDCYFYFSEIKQEIVGDLCVFGVPQVTLIPLPVPCFRIVSQCGVLTRNEKLEITPLEQKIATLKYVNNH